MVLRLLKSIKTQVIELKVKEKSIALDTETMDNLDSIIKKLSDGELTVTVKETNAPASVGKEKLKTNFGGTRPPIKTKVTK
jgi:hypothetical protein